MKHRKERIIAYISIVSGLITIIVCVADTPPFCKGFFACLVLVLVIGWLRQCYLDTKKFIKQKEESAIEMIREINESLTELKKSSVDFCSTCDRTRGEVIDYHNDVISKLDMPPRVEYDMEKVKAQLQHTIDEVPPNSVLKIICYGRKGYGYIVQYIAEKKKDIELEIILCRTEKNEWTKDDNNMIATQIQYMLNNGFKVYASEIPPAIRAAVVYSLKDNNVKKPIWCSFQSYKLGYNEKGHITLQCPEHYPIYIENESGDCDNLVKLVDAFETEYLYLMEHSKEAMLIEEGKIGYK